MAERYKTIPARSQWLTLAKLTPPDWYGWACVLAMFLLLAVRMPLANGVWFFPLLSLGEWLLLPLGVLSLSMGFLSLSRIREKPSCPCGFPPSFPPCSGWPRSAWPSSSTVPARPGATSCCPGPFT
ncbi:MAG: hypothetical protein LUG50_13080 [Planctomycetaceae bacterium]|nr:hypothetical protein [Planctomycetaceae bacterium]